MSCRHASLAALALLTACAAPQAPQRSDAPPLASEAQLLAAEQTPLHRRRPRVERAGRAVHGDRQHPLCRRGRRQRLSHHNARRPFPARWRPCAERPAHHRQHRTPRLRHRRRALSAQQPCALRPRRGPCPPTARKRRRDGRERRRPRAARSGALSLRAVSDGELPARARRSRQSPTARRCIWAASRSPRTSRPATRPAARHGAWT